jgi:hypothetical protein
VRDPRDGQTGEAVKGAAKGTTASRLVIRAHAAVGTPECTLRRPARGARAGGCVLLDDAFQTKAGGYRLLSSASYGSLLPDFARPRDTM